MSGVIQEDRMRERLGGGRKALESSRESADASGPREGDTPRNSIRAWLQGHSEGAD